MELCISGSEEKQKKDEAKEDVTKENIEDNER